MGNTENKIRHIYCINGCPLKAGDHFVATSMCDDLSFEGCMTLIVSHV